jgi:hypothetical protein
VANAAGNVSPQQASVVSHLIGTGHLTEKQTTNFVEYYKNGSGFSGDDADNSCRFVETAFAQYRLPATCLFSFSAPSS